MISLLKPFWVLLFLLQVHVLLAQSYNFDLISMEGGLPSNYVYDVYTDKKGFVWFTTDRGVARYDGYHIKVFTTADGLASNDVWRVWEDSQGRIWLYSFTKKVVFIEGDSVVLAWEKEVNSVYSNFYELAGDVYSVSARYLYQYKNGQVTKVSLQNDIAWGEGISLPNKNVLFFNSLDSVVRWHLMLKGRRMC